MDALPDYFFTTSKSGGLANKKARPRMSEGTADRGTRIAVIMLPRISKIVIANTRKKGVCCTSLTFC